MGFSKRFTALNATALALGAVAGLAAVGFRYLIGFIENLAFNGKLEFARDETGEFLVSRWGWMVFLVPAIGGLAIGLVRIIIPGAKRQGISEIMASVQARGGTILARTAWGHAIISAITVGTGGSTGREGPIGYIGGAFGSSMARYLGFTRRDVKVLVGAGTAAGIAATFNAPLGGVLFALELILPEFSTHAFIPLVLSTVIAVTVSHVFLADAPNFIIPAFEFVSPFELLFYMLLGILCGLGGVLFIKTLGAAQDWGEKIKIPYNLKPAAGGLAVGILGVAVFALTQLALFGGQPNYHIFGTGYQTVNAILQGEPFLLAIPILFLLLLLKPLASSLTIASGGGGGVFSASLYQGAIYGAIVGIIANALAPFPTAPVSAYALVGMGAFYASSGRATLTAIVLLTELTDGYTIVLPLMFAAVTADALSVGLSKESIYTIRLTKRGIRFDHDRTQSPLDTKIVSEVMTANPETLRADARVGDAYEEIIRGKFSAYPVVDGDRLIGMLTRKDLSRWIAEGQGDELIGVLSAKKLVTVHPTDMLYVARDAMHKHKVGRVLVVDPYNPDKLIGIISNGDIVEIEAENDVEHNDMWNSDRMR